MTSAGFTISGDDHPISPVMLGDAQLASDMADDMLSKFPFKKKRKMYFSEYIFSFMNIFRTWNIRYWVQLSSCSQRKGSDSSANFGCSYH